MSLPLVGVVAIADNGVIGQGKGLPWHISADLKRFRALTMGKPLIMGRKTFASLGRPLPGRETIVVTRDETFALPAALFRAANIKNAVQIAHERAAVLGAKEIIVAGGGEIYAALIDKLDRLHVTYVHASPEGDAFFPPIDWSNWQSVFREDHPAQGGDVGYTFVDYIRKGALSPKVKDL
jgi:dihydrofolate reductase